MKRDSIVQVKAYVKIRDQGRFIALQEARARAEVTAKEALCRQWGIKTLQDLTGLKVRRLCSRYLAFASTLKRVKTPRRQKGALKKLLADRRIKVALREALDRWPKYGVEGVPNWHGLMPVMDSVVNQRIGKAMGDLEMRLRRASLTAD